MNKFKLMIYNKKQINRMLLKRKGKKEKIIIKIRKMSRMIKQIKKIKVITIIYVRKLNNINSNSKMKLSIKNKEWGLSMMKKCFCIKIMNLVIRKGRREYKLYILILSKKSKFYF